MLNESRQLGICEVWFFHLIDLVRCFYELAIFRKLNSLSMNPITQAFRTIHDYHHPVLVRTTQMLSGHILFKISSFFAYVPWSTMVGKICRNDNMILSFKTSMIYFGITPIFWMGVSKWNLQLCASELDMWWENRSALIVSIINLSASYGNNVLLSPVYGFNGFVGRQLI